MGADALPSRPADSVPWLTAAQMRAIDDVVVGELGVELKQMMENAGRNLAALARELLGGSAAGRCVAVLAGPGGNGGGGLVAARHLLAAGASVTVHLAAPREGLTPVTRDQLAILAALGVEPGPGPADADLVLDAVLGYSQRGAPRGEAARLIEAAAAARVLALDVPSGLELATGTLHEPHVRAEATLTLAAPKEGLSAAAAGALYLADISVPPAAFQRIGVEYRTPFSDGPIVRLT